MNQTVLFVHLCGNLNHKIIRMQETKQVILRFFFSQNHTKFTNIGNFVCLCAVDFIRMVAFVWPSCLCSLNRQWGLLSQSCFVYGRSAFPVIIGTEEWIKGIFSDSNNIFSWHKSEDILLKKNGCLHNFSSF